MLYSSFIEVVKEDIACFLDEDKALKNIYIYSSTMLPFISRHTSVCCMLTPEDVSPSL